MFLLTLVLSDLGDHVLEFLFVLFPLHSLAPLETPLALEGLFLFVQTGVGLGDLFGESLLLLLQLGVVPLQFGQLALGVLFLLAQLLRQFLDGRLLEPSFSRLLQFLLQRLDLFVLHLVLVLRLLA